MIYASGFILNLYRYGVAIGYRWRRNYRKGTQPDSNEREFGENTRLRHFQNKWKQETKMILL